MNAPAAIQPTTSQPIKPRAELATLIEQEAPKWASALPPQIKPEAFKRAVLTALSFDPALTEADRKTFLTACLRAAQDGLLPDKKEGAFVIFSTKVKLANNKEEWVKAVQWMPMVYGIVKKLRNSGEIASIASKIVYQNEVEQGRFIYRIKDGVEEFVHEPILMGDRGPMALVYATARFKDGTVQTEILAKADVDKIRSVSKAGNSGPWVSWYDEMARKSAVRRLSKYLPLSAEDHRVLDRDDESVTEFERQKNAALSLAASQMGAKPAAIAAPTAEPEATPVADTYTQADDAVTVDAVAEDADLSQDVVDAAPSVAPPSDAAVTLENGLKELREVNTIAASEDLNRDMKAALAGTPEIGVWNSEFIQHVQRMKQAGHRK
jgi:recombination protein RecT